MPVAPVIVLPLLVFKYELYFGHSAMLLEMTMILPSDVIAKKTGVSGRRAELFGLATAADREIVETIPWVADACMEELK